MKRIVLSVLVALCGTLLSPLTASGQTFPDFVLANDGINSCTPSYSIIRTVNTTEAIVYYQEAGSNYVAAIDLYGNVNRISINTDCNVYDMRYCNGTVYLCGSYLNQAFIAAISYTDLLAGNPSGDPNIYILVGFSSNLVALHRMAVYYEPSTMMDKIVAIGEDLDPIPYYNYYAYINSVVVELNYNPGGTPSPFTYVSARSTNHAANIECVSEVVETQSYIALIGFHVNTKSLVIHRCPKGTTVLSTFDNFHRYPGSDGDGCSLFHGCRMKEDTIAIASLSVRELSPTHKFETRIRTFDLQTMSMTTAQAIDLDEDKAEPEELVYLPQYQTLVMLQDFCFLTPMHNYAFVHLKPYASSSYNAHGWVETSLIPNPLLSYRSVDLLQGEYYISSGGNYWLRKDSQLDVASTSCYTCGAVPVDHIMVSLPVECNDSYNKPVYLPSKKLALTRDASYLMSLICNP